MKSVSNVLFTLLVATIIGLSCDIAWLNYRVEQLIRYEQTSEFCQTQLVQIWKRRAIEKNIELMRIRDDRGL